jgi:hypothetical protein
MLPDFTPQELKELTRIMKIAISRPIPIIKFSPYEGGEFIHTLPSLNEFTTAN